MISFRTQSESISSTLIILAILMALGAGVWFAMPLPKPAVAGSPAAVAYQQQIKDLNKQITDNQKKGDDAEAAIEPLLWTDGLEKIGPQAQNAINGLVKKHGLKLVALRPQKPIEGQGLIQVPFGLTLDGPFPATMEFVKDLENENLKLAVTTVQISSADQASDRVTGNVSIAAFLRSPSAATGVQNAKKS